MTVEDLIRELQKMNPAANVFMGFNGNDVVTEPFYVDTIRRKKEIGEYWIGPKIGDVVLLEEE